METYNVIFIVLLSLMPALANIALFLFVVLLIIERLVSWFEAIKRWILLLN